MLEEMFFMSITVQKAMLAAAMIMLILVHVRAASRLPCLPAYLAPMIAKMMAGSIEMMVSMVPNWMLPTRMPNTIVVMIDWELTFCASFSATQEMVYRRKGLLSFRNFIISLTETSSPSSDADRPSKFSGLSMGVRPMKEISVRTAAITM